MSICFNNVNLHFTILSVNVVFVSYPLVTPVCLVWRLHLLKHTFTTGTPVLMYDTGSLQCTCIIMLKDYIIITI